MGMGGSRPKRLRFERDGRARWSNSFQEPQGGFDSLVGSSFKGIPKEESFPLLLLACLLFLLGSF